MKLPDRIFAIGGAGKAITMELLRSEWVVDEVLKPRPNPQSVTVTIVDTAEGEENTDRQELRAIEQHIAERERELRDASEGRTGTIDVEYKLVTDNIQLNADIDLTGEDTVPRIAAGNGMDEDDWWLGEGHINENLDFAKGVVRKRGLGKAIYYKAYAEDDQMSSYIDMPDKGKVAIIAGLGGGTGSGIFIDLAKHLRQKMPTAELTLFGVLPNHTEGDEERTNAFAALSELEYLSLTDGDLFKDRVLLPIDPTGFDGKKGNRIQTGQYLQEFDEALVYLITAYYNTEGMEDPFANSPDYAPFTIGIPQVLRYNVQAINEARESLREILGMKQEALEAEQEIYDGVDRFLSKHYEVDDVGGGLRNMDETDLRERMDAVENLIEFELFDELDYQSLSVYRSIIEDAREEGEDIGSVVTIAANSLRAGSAHQLGAEETFVDDIDEQLAGILERSITHLAHRRELLQRKKAIEDGHVRKTIDHLLLIGDSSVNAGVQLSRLEGKLDDINDREERLREELESTREEIARIREEQSDEVERQLEDWRRATADRFERYRTVQSLDVAGTLTDLQRELESYCTAVKNAENGEELDAVTPGEVTRVLDRLEEELDRAEVNRTDALQRIRRSLQALKNAKGAWLRMNAEEGTVEKFVPWESGTENDRKQAQKEYRMEKNKLDDDEVFSIGAPGTSFTAEVEFNTVPTARSVDRRESDLSATVVDEFRTRLTDADDSVREFEDRLDRGADLDELAELAERSFREQLSGTEEAEQREAELEAELGDIEADVGRFEAALDLFQSLNNLRMTYEEKQSEFVSQRSDYLQDDSTDSVSTEEKDYVYVKNIKPHDVLRTAGDSNIEESDLFNSREEMQRLRDKLVELAENTRRQQYTGLKSRKFSQGGSRYRGLKIRVSAQSRAMDKIDADVFDLEDVYGGSFDIGASGRSVESRYTTWDGDFGGPWDIGLSVFIDGIFLDNVRKAVDADGYFAGYRQRAQGLDGDILIHHSFGLDRGFCVRRNDVLNMEHPDDVGFYLRDAPEITEDLIENYHERVYFGESANPDVDPKSDPDGVLGESTDAETPDTEVN